MKKEYIRPDATVEEFDLKDVIMATSGGEKVVDNEVDVLSVQAVRVEDE